MTEVVDLDALDALLVEADGERCATAKPGVCPVCKLASALRVAWPLVSAELRAAREELSRWHALADRGLDTPEACLAAAQHAVDQMKRRTEAQADARKWRAAHNEMVSRNRLLRDRPDLPEVRRHVHDEWVAKWEAQEARIAELERRLDEAHRAWEAEGR